MERFGQVNFGALSQVLGMDPNVLMQICQNSVRQPAPIAAASVVQVVEEAVQENSDEDDYYSSEEEPAVNVFGPIRLAEFRRQNFVTLIDSQKNNKKAEYDGFLFVKQKLSKPNGAKQFWSCDKHKSSDGGCRARLHTLVEGDHFVKFLPHNTIVAHNHAINPAAPGLAIIKSSIKRRAVDTQEKPIQIFTNALQRLPESVSSGLSKSAVRKMAGRVRSRNRIQVPQANAVEEIRIPQDHRYYGQGGELFVLADSGEHVADTDRIIIFGRQQNLQWAAEMVNVYMDGTFSITPAPFTQVYVVLAEKESVVAGGGKFVFPIFYVLLKNKNRQIYEKMFRMILALAPQFQPTNFNVDFELAVTQVLGEHFPGSNINGCFFHMLKNFKKKIGEAGLMNRYRDANTNFAVTSRMLMSLAFVPLPSVLECFHELQSYLLRKEPSFLPVITWFSTYYVGTILRPAVFPAQLWSCYQRTVDGEDRTNNFAEASHRRLQTYLDVDHPSLGRFLEELKKIQKLYDHAYEQCIAGHSAPRKRKIYLDADKRILSLVLLFERRNLIEYLRGLARNFIMDQ